MAFLDDLRKQLLQPRPQAFRFAQGAVKGIGDFVNQANQRTPSWKVQNPQPILPQQVAAPARTFLGAAGSQIRNDVTKGIPALYNTANINLNTIQQRQRGIGELDILKNQAMDAFNAAKLGSYALGAPRLATKAGMVGLTASGVLGGGINKLSGGSFAEGAGTGVGMAPSIMGITRLTNPLIEQGVSRFAPGVATRLANVPFKNQIASRFVRGLGNIPEGAVIDASLGRRPMGIGSVAIDFITGAAGGSPGTRGVSNAVKQKYPKMNKIDIETATKAIDRVMRSTDPEYAVSQLRQQDEKVIRELAGDYLSKSFAKGKIEDVAQELWNRTRVDLNQPEGMALVGKVQALGGVKVRPRAKIQGIPLGIDSKLLSQQEQQQLSQVGNQNLQIKQPGVSPQGTVPKPYDGSIPQAYNAEANPNTLKKVQVRNTKAEAKAARDSYNEWDRAVKQQEGSRTTTGAVNDMTDSIKTNTVNPVAKDVSGYKDISGFTGQVRDVYRNFKKVFGNNYETVKKTVLDPFDRSKGVFTRNLDRWANELDTNIVKKYGFDKGSKESAAIQEYGEGAKTLGMLQEEFGTKKAQDIVQADKWFRKQYDTLLNEVNAERAKIYPNNPDKLIPKRADYYRHFKEMQQGFSGLANIFDSPANIESGLAGISANTKPKSKWLSFAQRRLGGESDVDAIGGFINYVKSAEYAKNIDPHIAKFRALREELAAATAPGTPQAGKLNNFIEFLDSYANDLAGKTNPADRFIQTVIPGGRKTMSVINWVNNRVKANVILGNASSSLAQIMNVPQGIANAGPVASAKGLGRTIASIFDDTKPIKNSDFIAERYSGGTFNRFDKGIINNGRKFAAWMVGALDEVGTKYIWNSHYEKALSEGIPNPTKYADDVTREMVAGRGIGEVPLIQKSKMFQLVAPFQLEVGNLWHVLGGWVGEKQFGKIATFLVASYVFNRGIEKVRGSDVSLDPIQASLEAYQAFNEEENKGMGATRAGGRLAGEVLSNVPLGQTIASIYPQYGFKVGDAQAPTREKLFGKGDPTRFGSGLLAVKGLQDPLFKVLLPFGGQQLERTIQGLGAVNQGYSESQSGRVQYPLAQTPQNYLQAGIFGKSSTPEARTYFNEDRSPLSEGQSEYFKGQDTQGRQDTYTQIINKRVSDKEETALTNKLSESKEGVVTVNNKVKYYDSETNSVKSINLGEYDDLPSTNRYEKAIKDSKGYSLANQIMNSPLSDSEKQQYLDQIGVDYNEAQYYNIASQNTNEKSLFVTKQLDQIVKSGASQEQFLKYLVDLRKSVNGDRIAADGVIDNLVEDGYISYEVGRQLKKVKPEVNDNIRSGKVKAKAKSTGKKKAAVKPPAFKAPTTTKIKLGKAKIAKVKLGRSKPTTKAKVKVKGVEDFQAQLQAIEKKVKNLV